MLRTCRAALAFVVAGSVVAAKPANVPPPPKYELVYVVRLDVASVQDNDVEAEIRTWFAGVVATLGGATSVEFRNSKAAIFARCAAILKKKIARECDMVALNHLSLDTKRDELVLVFTEYHPQNHGLSYKYPIPRHLCGKSKFQAGRERCRKNAEGPLKLAFRNHLSSKHRIPTAASTGTSQ